MNASSRFPWHWGVGIGLTYMLFAAGTVGMVIFALGQRVDLVSADYYSRSLAYDEQIAAASRGEALGGAVRCLTSDDGRAMIVAIPRNHAAASGTVTLYRPSGEEPDQVRPFAVDALGVQRVPLDGLARGRWIVKLEWQANGSRFYREQAVSLP